MFLNFNVIILINALIIFSIKQQFVRSHYVALKVLQKFIHMLVNYYWAPADNWERIFVQKP